jgi:hypothetical protein
MTTTITENLPDIFVNELSNQINEEFSELDQNSKDKILLLVANSLEKYEKLQNDNSNVNGSIVNNVKNGAKLGAKFVYNITAREFMNGRIPILDSIHRLVYRKLWNPQNPNGTEVFPKSEGYYRLNLKPQPKAGGKKNNKTKKNKKN